MLIQMIEKIYYKLNKVIKFPTPVFLKKIFKKYYSINELDKKLEKYIDYDNGYYIELGSYDGITQSNTYYFEKNKNWKGILIEPIKHKFLECKKNRSKKNKFFNGACVSSNYKKNKIKFVYSNLKSFSPIIIGKKKSQKQLVKPELLIGEKNFTFETQALTLNKILKKFNAPKIIDLLSLDTEGAEFEVLNGIDYSIYKFKYLLIETSKFNKLNLFLKRKNYKFIKKFSSHDYFFALKNY